MLTSDSPLRSRPKHKLNQDCVDDEEFYLRDGNVIILAEQTRFNVSIPLCYPLV